MKRLPVIISSLLFSTAALSADQAWFRLTGFSPDGEYVLWETGGVQDGSGFPWVRMEVLNTATSEPEEVFQHVWEDPELETPDFSIAERERADLCREFAIEPGNAGEPLVYYPVTELMPREDGVRFCLESYYPGYNSGELTLSLHCVEYGMPEGYPDWFGVPVTLSLRLESRDGSSSFFSEESPQEGYQYVFDYSLAGIWRVPEFHDRLLVVLHAVEPGFEGPDGRFRVVTGSI